MRRFLLKLLRRHQLQRDLEAELDFHRDMAAAHGNPVPLGNRAILKEEALDLWRFGLFENLWRDVVYGARGLRRSPALVFSVLLSLALGIGANTAMFSLAVEFLFSEPSVSDAGSLVSERVGGNSHSKEKVIDLIRESDLFQDAAGENEESFINWNDGAETRAGLTTVASRLDAAFPERWKWVNGCRVSPIAGFARVQAEKHLLTISLFFALLPWSAWCC
jgi:putative ABC transport system permease protein